jgi:hypothetical protein
MSDAAHREFSICDEKLLSEQFDLILYKSRPKKPFIMLMLLPTV